MLFILLFSYSSSEDELELELDEIYVSSIYDDFIFSIAFILFIRN